MAEGTVEPRVSRIPLDDATRARIAEELGLQAGVDAIPDQIQIVAIDPREAGHEDEPEVSGYQMSVSTMSNYFYNGNLTPALSPDKLLSGNVLSPRALTIFTVI